MSSGGADDLRQVCLAISSFRNDREVAALLEQLLGAGGSPFLCVLVVDSLGTGAIPKLIGERGWTGVEYHSFDRNLGSAGNLAQRFRLAAAKDARWVFALNHDGAVTVEAVRTLVSAAKADPTLGAVYPLRRIARQGNVFDLTGRSRVPFTARRVPSRPRESYIDVYWSSSNGALYNLEPLRNGLAPWEDLWHCWEDLAYGWRLHGAGYRQILVTEVVTDDPYEYEKQNGVWVAQKPPWIAYYSARNLLLIGKRTRQPLYVRTALLARVLAEYAVIPALRGSVRQRLSYLSEAIWDGLTGRAGKRAFP